MKAKRGISILGVAGLSVAALAHAAQENAEIARSWLLIGIRDSYQPSFVRLQDYLKTIRRGKLIKPLYVELNKAVWKAGAHVIGGYQPDDDSALNLSRDFYEIANDAQLDRFPAHYMRGLVDEMDHQVSVISESDPHALDTVEPARIMRRGKSMSQLLDWRGEKENAGNFTWTLGLYGTPAMAAEAGMSEEEYWEQIIHACFLDAEDPRCLTKFAETAAPTGPETEF